MEAVLRRLREAVVKERLGAAMLNVTHTDGLHVALMAVAKVRGGCCRDVPHTALCNPPGTEPPFLKRTALHRCAPVAPQLRASLLAEGRDVVAALGPVKCTLPTRTEGGTDAPAGCG